MKILWMIFLLSCHTLVAENIFLELPNTGQDIVPNARGNWQITFGASIASYYSSHNFVGVKRTTTQTRKVNDVDESVIAQKTYTPENFNTPGMSLGVAREIPLGKKFFLNIGLQGFFHRDKDDLVQYPSEDLNIAIAESHEHFNQWGAILSLGLGFVVKMKRWKYQPYIEAGFGISKAQINYNYFFDNGGASDPAPYKESYDVNIKEDSSLQRLGVGMDFIAPNGFFSYMRVYTTNYTINNATKSGTIQQNGSSEKNICSGADSCDADRSQDDLEFSATIGMGYRF